MKTTKEKSIHKIGIYFLVLGIICSFFCPIYFSSSYALVGPIGVVLMCVPRLIYDNKKWASILLMMCCIVTTLALLFFDAMLIILSNSFEQNDVSGDIVLIFITAIVLLNIYLCSKLYKLLFKTE